jgi:hypothetical protein
VWGSITVEYKGDENHECFGTQLLRAMEKQSNALFSTQPACKRGENVFSLNNCVINKQGIIIMMIQDSFGKRGGGRGGGGVGKNQGKIRECNFIFILTHLVPVYGKRCW